MEIECPICSTSIEITEAHIGRKGRCPTCESKFIIPEDPDAEFEILVRGEVPEELPDKKVSLVVPSRKGEDKADRKGPIGPKVIVTNGGGPSPVTVGVVATCVAIVIALVASNRDDGGENSESASWQNEIAENSQDPAPTQETPQPSNMSASNTPGLEDGLGAADPEPAPAPDPDPDPEPNPVEVAAIESVDEGPPALTDEQKANALGFLKSKQAKQRKAAYLGYRKLGDREKASYREALNLAREHHGEALSKRASDLTIGDNHLSEFKEAFDEWSTAKDTARALVQKNWKDAFPKDYKKKHAEMDKATEEASKLYVKLMRSLRKAEKFEASGFTDSSAALNEISAEINWCDSRVPDSPLGLHDLLKQVGGAEDYVRALNMIGDANKIAAGLEAAEEHNDGSGWASAAYKSFATILNERRVAIGLGALRLDEKLSKACLDHSADMAANNYFSHTGLTDETRSFSKRAKRAGFTGFATGECIFMGSASASAAHKAWWYSDGHRLIMYAGNPNTLGLGLSGVHWTLNTGKK